MLHDQRRRKGACASHGPRPVCGKNHSAVPVHVSPSYRHWHSRYTLTRPLWLQLIKLDIMPRHRTLLAAVLVAACVALAASTIVPPSASGAVSVLHSSRPDSSGSHVATASPVGAPVTAADPASGATGMVAAAASGSPAPLASSAPAVATATPAPSIFEPEADWKEIQPHEHLPGVR